MNALEFLSQFPKYSDFSRKSKILIFAYYLRKYNGEAEFGAADIRKCFREAMLRVPGDLTALLKSLASGRESAIIKSRSKGRYSLSIHGLNEVESVLPVESATQERLTTFLASAIPYLKKTIAKVEDETRREFVAEAVACLGVEARRATVVMTWLAVMDHLYAYVLKHKLVEFNGALQRRADKLSNLRIRTSDDFGEIKESVFIELCRSARIITNDVRKILDEKIATRNSCAHPAAIKIGDAKVVSFIEDLVDNIVAKYEI